LQVEGIDVVLVDSRTKSVESFVEKIRRKQGNYEDPLEEVKDLSGVRIITYYTEDVSLIGRLISDNFDVVEHQPNRLGYCDSSDRFGYSAEHYVVRPGPGRVVLAEWRHFRDLCAEIQVRTALQHAWSSVSHKLHYKREDTVPLILRRRLSRLSALFELADEQFSLLRDASDQLDKQYVGSVGRGELELPLDSLSLGAYLDSIGASALLGEVTNLAGWRLPPPKVENENLFAQDRQDLIRVAVGLQLKTIAELDAFIKDRQTATVMRMIFEEQERRGLSVEATPDDVLVRAMLARLGHTSGELLGIYSSPAADVIVTVQRTQAPDGE